MNIVRAFGTFVSNTSSRYEKVSETSLERAAKRRGHEDWAWCKSQAERLGMTTKEFKESMNLDN